MPRFSTSARRPATAGTLSSEFPAHMPGEPLPSVVTVAPASLVARARPFGVHALRPAAHRERPSRVSLSPRVVTCPLLVAIAMEPAPFEAVATTPRAPSPLASITPPDSLTDCATAPGASAQVRRASLVCRLPLRMNPPPCVVMVPRLIAVADPAAAPAVTPRAPGPRVTTLPPDSLMASTSPPSDVMFIPRPRRFPSEEPPPVVSIRPKLRPRSVP